MTTTNDQAFLKKERGNTDNSLNTERGQADETLLSLRKKTERETDKQVESDRGETDLVRAQVRSDQDSLDAPTTSVDENRLLVDKSVSLERSKMDAALKNERIQKDVVFNEILHQEREETDGNLLHEREKTDKAVRLSSTMLDAAKSAHLKTKAELTTRDEFLAIVSHDLRNPLGAILSSAQILLEDLGPSSNDQAYDQAKTLLEIVRRNAETSIRLISDILDMERFVSGKLELRMERQNLDKVLKETYDTCAHAAAQKKIKITLVPSNVDALAEYDQDRIAQVLSNLVGNAIKFTPENGSVTLSLVRQGDSYKVCVADTGPGIPDTQREKIFERYAQLSNAGRSGLGLGLYISKSLVEAHKGKLWVESTEKTGSTFCFTLPVS
jgi:signal transduction histidine kinase